MDALQAMFPKIFHFIRDSIKLRACVIPNIGFNVDFIKIYVVLWSKHLNTNTSISFKNN